jgi:hypothetical protein
MQAGAEGFTDAQKDQAQSFYKDRMGAADQRQRDRRAEMNERLLGREGEFSERRSERDDAFLADLQASENALKQARTEWRDAVDEASRKRAEAESESAKKKGEEPSLEAPGLIDELKKKLGQAGQATASAAERAVSVQGTFNASSILGLQSGNAADRTAKASEETAKNTRKLLGEAKLGGLTFS